jgi:hypothetical protein
MEKLRLMPPLLKILKKMFMKFLILINWKLRNSFITSSMAAGGRDLK